MTDKKKTAENRRKLLKTVAAGGGAIIAGKTLPDSWSRPVVDSILLPVHAQTSSGPFGGTSSNSISGIESDSLFARATRSLVSEAAAVPQPPVPAYDFTYCITPVSDDTANVAVLVSRADACFMEPVLFTRNNVVINSGPQLMDLMYPCQPQPVQGSSAADWLDSLGVIKDAMASYTSTIELTKVMGEAAGTFNFDSGFLIDNFTWTGSCPSTDPICCED